MKDISWGKIALVWLASAMVVLLAIGIHIVVGVAVGIILGCWAVIETLTRPNSESMPQVHTCRWTGVANCPLCSTIPDRSCRHHNYEEIRNSWIGLVGYICTSCLQLLPEDWPKEVEAERKRLKPPKNPLKPPPTPYANQIETGTTRKDNPYLKGGGGGGIVEITIHSWVCSYMEELRRHGRY